MIIETAMACLTSIILGSLWVSSRILKAERDEREREKRAAAEKEEEEKREAAEKEEERRQEREEESGPPPVVFPFVQICIGTPCPLCGSITTVKDKPERSGYTADETRGVATLPQACARPGKCRVKEPHLHGKCFTCKGTFAMRTATTPSLEGEKENNGAA